MDEKIILIKNPKIHFNFRVVVCEDRKEMFMKLLEEHGYVYTEINNFKQNSICINLENVIREGK